MYQKLFGSVHSIQWC